MLEIVYILPIINLHGNLLELLPFLYGHLVKILLWRHVTSNDLRWPGGWPTEVNQDKTLVLCAILFAILWHFEILRVHPDTECRGIDIQKHGEPAYPQVYNIYYNILYILYQMQPLLK